MFRQKKGQAAMEFLMTYGWAILVVLAAIGALAYFGVLSPEKLVPERTTFTAPFPSSEAGVVDLSASTVTVAMTNNFGQKVQVLEIGNATDDCLGASSLTVLQVGDIGGSPADTNVSNGETFIMQWTCSSFIGAIGDRFETELTFSYQTPSGLVHTHAGTVSGQVKP